MCIRDSNIAISEMYDGRRDIRWDYSASGGSTMDLGCHPTTWVRHAVQASFPGEGPSVVSAVATERPEKIDADLAAELEFPSGATGRVESSMISPEADVRLEVVGTRGLHYRSQPAVTPKRKHPDGAKRPRRELGPGRCWQYLRTHGTRVRRSRTARYAVLHERP